MAAYFHAEVANHFLPHLQVKPKLVLFPLQFSSLKPFSVFPHLPHANIVAAEYESCITRQHRPKAAETQHELSLFSVGGLTPFDLKERVPEVSNAGYRGKRRDV
jgi:hypothetical protein